MHGVLVANGTLNWWVQPIQIRMAAGFSMTAWEAVVPFTEKSVGLFLGGQLRRPVLVQLNTS